MSKLHEVGFQRPASGAPAPTLRPVAVVQLIATVTLALSTLIAATVVSIGFARADIADPMAAAEAVPFAAAWLVGLASCAAGGAAAAMIGARRLK